MARLSSTKLSAISARRVTLGPLSVSSVVVIGDSIAVGINGDTSGVDVSPWAARVASGLGASLLNQGISGTVLQNSADAGGSARPNNGRDRYISTLLGQNRREMVIVAYGFNDARYVAAPSTFNVTQYRNDLTEVVLGLIGGGYQRDRIVIVTPYFITDAGLATGSTGFAGQTRAGFEAFVRAATEVADTQDVWIYDAYSWMRDNGGASLIGTDNIHPNALGHQAIATGFFAATRRNWVYDTFSDSDGTPITRHSGERSAIYSAHPTIVMAADAAIAGGRVYGQATNNIYLASGQPDTPNYDVAARFVCVSEMAGDNMGIFARIQPSEYTSYFVRYGRSQGSWGLFSQVAGFITPLGTPWSDPFPTGAVRDVILRVNGPTISVLIDGVARIQASDSAVQLAGFGGLRIGAAQSPTTGIHIDSFAVRPIA